MNINSIKFNRQIGYTSRGKCFNDNNKNRNNNCLTSSIKKLYPNENEQEAEKNILYIKRNENIKANNMKNININKNKKNFKKIQTNKNYRNVKIYKNNIIGVNQKKMNNLYININQSDREFFVIKKIMTITPQIKLKNFINLRMIINKCLQMNIIIIPKMIFLL